MKKILINKNIWQTRVAILREDRLQDIYFDNHNKVDLERSFFKGRISKILPGIQTAFVDIGQQKAGFLHITEIDHALAIDRIDALQEENGKDTEISASRVKHHMNMEKVFKEGEEVLVQVIKEPVYEKGAKLTTCFALPGRFVVLMPNIPQVGVSKKIEDRDERFRLKEIVSANLPKGMGAIVRTTSEERSASDLKKDIALQVELWKSIQKKAANAKVGDRVHDDLSISLRVIRDHLDDDVEVILTDDKENQNDLTTFINSVSKEHTRKIRLYSEPPSLFERFNVDKQIEKALQKKVPLKSGGSLIIETTEAMTVVDVNTGRFTGTSNVIEDTILKNNLEAAEEVVTQLRLRNIGGLIVIDFVDMASQGNRQKLSRLLEKTLKERDKFQSVALKVSEFGLVQMTRKRSGKTLVQQLTNSCTACNSNGFVKSTETECYEVLTDLKNKLREHRPSKTFAYSVSPEVFNLIIEKEYQSILDFEKKFNCKIILESDSSIKN